jgi:hypothetical protein
MYCLRQFSEIIEELCQKRWIDFVRLNKQNLVVLDGLPDLDEFMFAPSRNQLGQVADFLIDLQQCQCFYCGKVSKIQNMPWIILFHGLYILPIPDITLFWRMTNVIHRKVIIWHHEQFLDQWRERNHLHDQSIIQISQLGFLTDLQRSHRVADWAYKQAIENEYLVWLGGKRRRYYPIQYLLYFDDIYFINFLIIRGKYELVGLG